MTRFSPSSPFWYLAESSLRTKMLVIVVTTSLIAILVASLALFGYQAFSLRRQFQTQMESLARVVADYAIAPVSFADQRAMSDALAVLQSRPEVVEAELRAPDNRVLAKFGESAIDEQQPETAQSKSEFVGWYLLVRLPLSVRDESLGSLTMVASFQPVFFAAVGNFIPAMTVIFLGALIIIVPVTWLMAGVLLRGLHQLAGSADRIASTGDYTVRAPHAGRDEVGQLTETFNAMLDKLQDADRELRSINQTLNLEIAERTRLEQALVESSRLAGMAEVATGVLHNVGNVLNSVNVSAQLVRERLESSRLTTLGRTAKLLEPHRDNPQPFYTQNPKALLLPGLIIELQQELADEHRDIHAEMLALNRNIEHIKEVVSSQQSFARTAGVSEPLVVAALFADAVGIHLPSIERHQVRIVRDLAPPLPLIADRHDTLQILINLISNAIHAVKGNAAPNRIVTLRSFERDQKVVLVVQDNGSGIAPSHLTRIFQHGFTTRDDGHGFGLHSGAIAARRMAGSLHVASEGLGRGATFTLELPILPSNPPPRPSARPNTANPFSA